MGTAGTVMNKSSSHLRLTVAFCLSVEIYWPTSYTAAPSWMDAAHLQRQRAMGFGHQPTWEKIQLLFCWLFSLSFFLFFCFFFFFLSWFIWTFFFFFSLGGTCPDIYPILQFYRKEKKTSLLSFACQRLQVKRCHHGMSKAEQSPPGEKGKISCQHCKFQRPPMNTVQWCSLILSDVSPALCRESSFLCFSGVSKTANGDSRII